MISNKLYICLLSISLILISTTNALGQSNRSRYRQISTLDLIVGGDFGFRLISGDGFNPEITEEVNNRNEYEDLKLNSRFGTNYNVGISKRFLLKTGIRYANPGFRISSINKIDPGENINAINKSFLLQGIDYWYKYQMIEIPVGFKYVFSESWCKSYLELGIAPTFYWKTIVKETYYEAASSRMSIGENINEINYIATLSIGGDLEISENFSGFSQLTGRYQLNNLRQGDLVEKIVGLGVELGVRMHL